MVMDEQERKQFYQSTEWRRLRRKALERDHYECQWCAMQGKVSTANDTVLEVDHIKELKDYPELALDINNLRTLCKECHNERHNRFNFKSNQSKKKHRKYSTADFSEWW